MLQNPTRREITTPGFCGPDITVRADLGQSSEMFWKLIAAAAWAGLAFIIYATLSSLSERPELTSSETDLIVAVERFGAYALLGILFMVTYHAASSFVCLLVLGSAVCLSFCKSSFPTGTLVFWMRWRS